MAKEAVGRVTKKQHLLAQKLIAEVLAETGDLPFQGYTLVRRGGGPQLKLKEEG